MSSKLLSDGLFTNWGSPGDHQVEHDSLGPMKVIEAVRELEAENERLKGERTKTESAGELLGSAFNDAIKERDALRAELEETRTNSVSATFYKQVVDDGHKLRVEVERLKNVDKPYEKMIAERDALRTEVDGLEAKVRDLSFYKQETIKQFATVAKQRDEARAEADNASDMYSHILNQRADWEDESDKLYAERDDLRSEVNRLQKSLGFRADELEVLRTEVELLRRDRDGKIREAFDHMSKAVRERDEARAELEKVRSRLKLRGEQFSDAEQLFYKTVHERDVAIRECDEARAELATFKTQKKVSAEMHLDRLTAERDAALAKLERVREWAERSESVSLREHTALMQTLDAHDCASGVSGCCPI